MLTRRFLLQALLSGVGSAAAGARRLTQGLSAAGAWLLATVAPADGSASLTTSAVETLVALAESVVDGRPISAAARRDLAEHIEGAAGRDQDRRALYRTTVDLLDGLAGRPFARLDFADRVALVTRHRLNVRTVTSDEGRAVLSEAAHAVRTRAVPDLIAAYWGSPAGWAAVGYAAFPGRCGDLTRYTRPEP